MHTPVITIAVDEPVLVAWELLERTGARHAPTCATGADLTQPPHDQPTRRTPMHTLGGRWSAPFPSPRCQRTRATPRTCAMRSQANAKEPTMPPLARTSAFTSAGAGTGRSARASPIRTNSWTMNAP